MKCIEDRQTDGQTNRRTMSPLKATSRRRLKRKSVDKLAFSLLFKTNIFVSMFRRKWGQNMLFLTKNRIKFHIEEKCCLSIHGQVNPNEDTESF